MDFYEIPERVRVRFWSRVDVGEEDACWPFRLSIGSHGYGQVGWQDGREKHMVLAHRVAYVLTVGPIPDDMTVDHRCRVRRCCNPRHLRLLTNLENARDNGMATRTHCPAGHPYDKANTYEGPTGGRRCRTCARTNARRRRALRAQARRV